MSPSNIVCVISRPPCHLIRLIAEYAGSAPFVAGQLMDSSEGSTCEYDFASNVEALIVGGFRALAHVNELGRDISGLRVICERYRHFVIVGEDPAIRGQLPEFAGVCFPADRRFERVISLFAVGREPLNLDLFQSVLFGLFGDIGGSLVVSRGGLDAVAAAEFNDGVLGPYAADLSSNRRNLSIGER